MSYILDALKRADAERERGRVPGLHSQAGTAVAPAAEPASSPARRWPMTVPLALGLLLATAVAYWAFRPSADAPTLATPVASASPPALAPPTQAPPIAPAAPPAPVPEPMLAPAPPRAVPPSPAPVQARPAAPVQPSAPSPSPRPVATDAVASPAPSPASTPAPAAPPAAAQPSDRPSEAVRRYADLSAEQRAALPQLSVNGSSYSANPAHRLLVINGAVVQEGQEAAPGLVLERIGQREAVLNHQGLRFSIGY